MNTFLDLTSKSVTVLQILPFLIYLATSNIEYLKIQLGWFIVSWSTDVFKLGFVRWFPNSDLFRRPGGEHCGMLNESNHPHSPAFPSGHLTSAAYILTSLVIQLSRDHYITRSSTIHMLVVLYLTILSYSRVYKKCHTILQVLVGIFYGVVMARWISKVKMSETLQREH